MPAATLFRSTFTLARADLPQLPPLMQERLCASDQPLVLLPVRLETRFFAQPDGSSELRVRIYPDKIHLDSHEPGAFDETDREGLERIAERLRPFLRFSAKPSAASDRR